MRKPVPYANLLIGCVLIGMRWGFAAGAGAFFIGLAMVGKSTTDHTDHTDKTKGGTKP
jgi:hypothetical protein